MPGGEIRGLAALADDDHLAGVFLGGDGLHQIAVAQPRLHLAVHLHLPLLHQQLGLAPRPRQALPLEKLIQLDVFTLYRHLRRLATHPPNQASPGHPGQVQPNDIAAPTHQGATAFLKP